MVTPAAVDRAFPRDHTHSAYRWLWNLSGDRICRIFAAKNVFFRLRDQGRLYRDIIRIRAMEGGASGT